jgi:zinc protease
MKLLEEVGTESLSALARDWMSMGSLVVQFVLPESEQLSPPTEEEVLRLLEDVPNRKLDAPEEDEVDFTLMEAPSPGAVAKRDRIEELGIDIIYFENGIELWLKKTDFSSQEVLVDIWSYGGAVGLAEDQYYSAKRAGMLTLLSGLGDHGLASLAKNLSGVETQIIPSIGDFKEGFEGKSSVDELEYLFQFLWYYFEDPRFSTPGLALLKRLEKPGIKNRDKEPKTAFYDANQRLLWGEHHRVSPWTLENLSSVDSGAAEKIYKERFANPADFRYFIVGNFDPVEVEELALRYLASLPTSDERESLSDDGLRRRQGTFEETVYSGTEDKASVRLTWHGDFEGEWEERNHFYAVDSILEKRLRQRLREEMGGVYSVSVWGSTSAHPVSSYQFTVSFNAEPARVDELLAATEEEIQRFIQEGVTAEELEALNEQDRKKREEQVMQDSFWLSTISSAVYRGEDPLDILGYDQRVSSRTVEDIQAMALKLFETNMLGQVEVVMQPKEMGNK